MHRARPTRADLRCDSHFPILETLRSPPCFPAFDRNDDGTWRQTAACARQIWGPAAWDERDGITHCMLIRLTPNGALSRNISISPIDHLPKDACRNAHTRSIVYCLKRSVSGYESRCGSEPPPSLPQASAIVCATNQSLALTFLVLVLLVNLSSYSSSGASIFANSFNILASSFFFFRAVFTAIFACHSGSLAKLDFTASLHSHGGHIPYRDL